MPYTLGLDLGSSSLGWALVDEEQQNIIKTGVRVFPGAATDIGTGKESYKNQDRRLSRQARRQTLRRKQRRIVLLRTLVDFKMCPLSKDELESYAKYRKGKKQEFPSSSEFNSWLKLNPYELRDRALHEDISRFEFGRILYHIIHHRGFKTGRKSNEDGALYKGNEDTVGVDETKNLLQQYATLGEYLNSLRIKSDGNERLRGRYTLRNWYVDEFNKIWERQAGKLGLENETVHSRNKRYYGPAGSSEHRRKLQAYKKAGISFEIEGDFICREQTVSLKDYLGNPDKGILFYQKPLKSQKHLLSKCRYEKRKSVCQISHPEFEYYRAMQFANQIEYGAGEKLNETDRKDVIILLLSKDKAVKMSDLKKKIQKTGVQFNYADDHKVPGSPTTAFISKVTDTSNVENIDWELFHSIWNDLVFYDKSEKLKEKFQRSYNIDVSIEQLNKYKINTDYSSLSLKAVRNINPFLQMGMLYNDAVIFAGIRRVIGEKSFDANADEIISHVSKLKEKNNRDVNQSFTDALREYVMQTFNISMNQTYKLYHHSQEMSVQNNRYYLSELPNLRNPIVQQALQELRTLVNTLVEQYLPDGEQFSKIKVELARELKLPRDVRRRMHWENNQRAERNNDAKIELQKFGLSPSRENIQKYILYKEIQNSVQGQSVQCPYTGQSLAITDVFGNDNKVQVEHIIPYSISLDDSLSNKTLCIAEENGKKGEKTPYQFYKSDPDHWEVVKARAFTLLPYEKAKRFVSTRDYEPEAFLQRQLNDTRYISKAARDYLSTICDQVYVFPGSLTAKVRRMWGLNSILSPPIKTNFEGNAGMYWAVMNDDGVIIELSEQELPPPAIRASDILISGEMKNGIFKVDRKFTGQSQTREVSVEHRTYDSPGWMVYSLLSVEKYLPLFSKLPSQDTKSIWLKGRAQVKDRESPSLMLNSLPVKLMLPPGEYDDNAPYWVNIPVNGELRWEKRGEKPGKNELLIKRTKHRDGKVEAFIDKRKCLFDIPPQDNKSALIIPLDLQEILQVVRMFTPTPAIAEHQFLIKGKIDQSYRFTAESNFRIALDAPEGTPSGPAFAIANCEPRDMRFYPKKNIKPKNGKGKNVLSGFVFQEDGSLVFNPGKNRMDHRHHAIDALTIALLNTGQLRELSGYFLKIKKRQRYSAPKPQFPLPWDNFRADALNSINSILVVHRQNREIIKRIKKNTRLNGRTYVSQGMSVRGQLHKDTVYGKHYIPGSDEPGYHVRKQITDLTSLSKIADAGTHEILRTFVEENGYSIDEKEKVKGEWFTKGNDYQVIMPSSGKPGNPIKKVRIRENLGNAVQWHTGINQYVNPRNNYAFIIYRDSDGNYKEHPVTFWDAVQARLAGKSVYQLPEPGKIITTLHINDTFLLGLGDEQLQGDLPQELVSRHLYRVQKLSSMYYCFRLHTESTLDRDFEPYYLGIQSFKAWKEQNPLRVKVATTGEVNLE